jgi:hypothetical protein
MEAPGVKGRGLDQLPLVSVKMVLTLGCFARFFLSIGTPFLIIWSRHSLTADCHGLSLHAKLSRLRRTGQDAKGNCQCHARMHNSGQVHGEPLWASLIGKKYTEVARERFIDCNLFTLMLTNIKSFNVIFMPLHQYRRVVGNSPGATPVRPARS